MKIIISLELLLVKPESSVWIEYSHLSDMQDLRNLTLIDPPSGSYWRICATKTGQ